MYTLFSTEQVLPGFGSNVLIMFISSTHFCNDILYFLLISLYLLFAIKFKSFVTISSKISLYIPKLAICIIRHSERLLAPTPLGSNCWTLIKHFSKSSSSIFKVSTITFSSVLKYPSSSRLSIIYSQTSNSLSVSLYRLIWNFKSSYKFDEYLTKFSRLTSLSGL